MPTLIGGPFARPAFRGIYDLPEAARYLRAGSHPAQRDGLRPPTLIRWIRNGLSWPDLTDAPGRQLLLEFEHLISMRVIAALRASRVPWGEIRRTEQWLRDARRTPHPFATELLWTGQGDLFAEWAENLVSGSRHGQAAFVLLREYVIPVSGLAFSGESGVAVSWSRKPACCSRRWCNSAPLASKAPASPPAPSSGWSRLAIRPNGWPMRTKSRCAKWKRRMTGSPSSTRPSVRFRLDELLDPTVASALVLVGYDFTVGAKGEQDPTIIDWCRANQAVWVHADDRARRQHQVHLQTSAIRTI